MLVDGVVVAVEVVGVVEVVVGVGVEVELVSCWDSGDDDLPDEDPSLFLLSLPPLLFFLDRKSVV